jgi:hypothetical protein
MQDPGDPSASTLLSRAMLNISPDHFDEPHLRRHGDERPSVDTHLPPGRLGPAAREKDLVVREPSWDELDDTLGVRSVRRVAWFLEWLWVRFGGSVLPSPWRRPARQLLECRRAALASSPTQLVEGNALGRIGSPCSPVDGYSFTDQPIATVPPSRVLYLAPRPGNHPVLRQQAVWVPDSSRVAACRHPGHCAGAPRMAVDDCAHVAVRGPFAAPH